MTASQNFIDLCIHFECSGHPEKYLAAYQDQKKIWTIGVGSTVMPNGLAVKEGDTITIAQCHQLLVKKIQSLEKYMATALPDGMSQGQYDAVVDLAYNIGEDAFAGSHVHQAIKAKANPIIMLPFFMAWNKIKKGNIYVESAGLTRRRECEYYLYLKGENHPTFFE